MYTLFFITIVIREMFKHINNTDRCTWFIDYENPYNNKKIGFRYKCIIGNAVF